jgi:cellulose synthase/poly-beta-1,6-N-acetylglucosamine synthase-like glycosyltransferase
MTWFGFDTMTFVYWTSLALIAYVYVGYPLLLVVWSRLMGRPTHADSSHVPGVSVIVVVRNEAARLAARLDNLLGLDYPADRRQVIVVSDGSTDSTSDLLRRYAPVVDSVRLPPVGKAEALNHGVPLARFDTLVFADARQLFAPDTLREIVAPLADPAVGAVSGELVLDGETAERRHGCERRAESRTDAGDRRVHARSVIAEGMGLYWKYEKSLRRMESAVGSMLGATGAVYAMRRSLWQPLPPGTLLDDVLAPMRVVLRGRRVVFHEAARAFDRASESSEVESRRKVRTQAGNVQILWLEPRLLVPFVNPVWIQYVSHKVGRLAVPYAMAALLAVNIVLAPRHMVYAVTLLAQCAFYLLAAYGAYLDRRQSRAAGEPAQTVPARTWSSPSEVVGERPVQ